MRPGDPRVLSMSIGGTFDLAEVKADAWRRFAEQIEMDEELVLAMVGRIADQLPAAVEEGVAEVGDVAYADDVRERLVPAVRLHCAEVSRGLKGQALA